MGQMKHCRVSVFLNNTLCRNLTFDTFPAVLVTPLAQPRSVLEVGKLGILESPSLWETSPGGSAVAAERQILTAPRTFVKSRLCAHSIARLSGFTKQSGTLSSRGRDGGRGAGGGGQGATREENASSLQWRRD